MAWQFSGDKQFKIELHKLTSLLRVTKPLLGDFFRLLQLRDRLKLSTIPGPSAIYQLEAFVRMGPKDVLVNLQGAMCLIALNPSLSCLPSVPTVSHSGEAFGVEGFFAEASRVFLRVLRPCWYVLGVFCLGGGVLSLPVCQAGRSHQQLSAPC